MMQMLEAAGVPILCDDERTPDDSNPRGYYELAAVKATARDASWVARAPGHAVKVIHALLHHLPLDRSYRVILMKRDLREVIASQARMLATTGQPQGELPEERLADIFAAQLDQARQTLDSNSCFEWLEVHHGDLIANGRDTAHEISRFLNLCNSIDAMSAVIDQALHRTHSPIPRPEGEA